MQAAGLGITTTAGGNVSLTNAANNVGTLAINAAGTVNYKDADGFNVGTVGAVAGLSGTNVTLAAGGNVGTATGGVITATGLGVSTTLGSITLNNANNDVTTLALNAPGDIVFTDKSGFNVGTVGPVAGLSGANVTLAAGGNVGTAAGGVVTATGLAVSTTAGGIALNNASNDVTTLALNAPGDITFTDKTGFTIGTIGPVSGITASTAGSNVTLVAGGNVNGGPVKATGLAITTTGGGNVDLTNAANDVTTLAANAAGFVRYTDANGITVGNVAGIDGITSGKFVTLNSTGLTQAAGTAGKIVAPEGLALLGTGDRTIDNLNSSIGSFAFNIAGKNLTITQSKDVAIGLVDGVNGVTAATLTINATGKNITQTAPVIAPTVTLNNVGGNVTLNNAGNDFGTVNALTTGVVSLTDKNGIIVTGVAASQINVTAPNGDVTITAPVDLNMGLIQGQTVILNAGRSVLDANGKLTNVKASVTTKVDAKTGIFTTDVVTGPFDGINTPTLYAFAGGINAQGKSIDVYGAVGDDTITWPNNPRPLGTIWLNGRQLDAMPSGVITRALQSDLNSTGQVLMNDPLSTSDAQIDSTFTTDSLRITSENLPAPLVGEGGSFITINGPGMRLPAGVPVSLGVMQLTPGGAPMNLPNGTVVGMATNGDILITLPAGGMAAEGLAAVTITPAGIAVGRDASGMPMPVEGGIAGNAQLKSLLDQIADFLPEEYRRKWGLRTRSAQDKPAAAGVKVSQL